MLAEAGRARAEAERDLTADYLRRVGRESAPAADGEATAEGRVDAVALLHDGEYRRGLAA